MSKGKDERKPEIVANGSQGYSDGAGRPFGWSWVINSEGLVEFEWFATPEVNEKIVNKKLSLILTLKQLEHLAHDAQAARNKAMEIVASREE